MLVRMWRKRTLMHCWWECKLVQPLWKIVWRFIKRFQKGGFPGGAVVKNLPANARHTGLSPAPGGSHMPQSNKARAPQLLSLCSRGREPQLLSPRATTTEACTPRARAPQQEKPLQ